MRKTIGSIIVAAGLAGGAIAQPASPGTVVSTAEIQAAAAAAEAGMKPGQGFAWKPLLQAGATNAAVEVWRKPGKPAVHPTEAEYATVLSGRGTLVYGGTMADAKETRPTLIEGSRIDGGTTRALVPGDTILIAAGVPHWFGIDGEKLVLLGIKVPVAK
jgi:quercetin dioxygenase-like cupin family protein